MGDEEKNLENISKMTFGEAFRKIKGSHLIAISSLLVTITSGIFGAGIKTGTIYEKVNSSQNLIKCEEAKLEIEKQIKLNEIEITRAKNDLNDVQKRAEFMRIYLDYLLLQQKYHKEKNQYNYESYMKAREKYLSYIHRRMDQ